MGKRDVDPEVEAWNQLSNDEKRDELIQMELSPVAQCYEDAGITLEKLAREVKRCLNARSVRHQKIKGTLPPNYKLPPGYRVIIASERIAFLDDDGVEFVAEPGESIIEYKAPDLSLRLKTVESVLRTLGANAPERQEIERRDTVVIVKTHMPRPDPLPAGFKNEDNDDDG